MLRKVIISLALCLPGVAHSQTQWRAATSNNFIVYSRGKEATAREIATKLEKFYFVLRFVSGQAGPSVPAPIKVKVYLVADQQAVQDTMAFPSQGVAGYYSTGERGPFAVMGKGSSGGEFGLGAQEVLFHELTHHFMFQYHPAVYPSWYVEGFADFYGTTVIKANDVVEVGQPMANRYLSFLGGEWLPAQKLLTAKRYADVGDQVLLMYTEGWLLVHYLGGTKERAAMLKKYLHEINIGIPFDQAAKDGFGDLNKLNRELRAYAQASGAMKSLQFPFKPIDPGKIEQRSLTPAENALIDIDISLHSGIPVANAPTVAARARAIGARFPDDPYALRIVTEAQRLAGNDSGAQNTVNHWLAVAPNDPMALMQKGSLAIAALTKEKSIDTAAWAAARAPILNANRAAPNEPQIQRALYESYAAQGGIPPESAQDVLLAALDLTPLDDDIRYRAARDFELRGAIDDAIETIRPAAYRIHADSEKTPQQREKDAKLKAKYKLAGEVDTETSIELLNRLEKKRAESGALVPAPAPPAPTAAKS